MSDSSHVEIVAQGADAWNTWRTANPNTKPDLTDADLSDLDLAGANLGEADLSGADLYGTKLGSANLKMTVLSGTDLSGTDLSGAELYKANLSKAYLTQADLTGCYLAGANLAEADLRGAKLVRADLSECDLSSADLSHADLTGATLAQANIANADLCHTDFAQANLMGLRYGSFRSMSGHYQAIRGLDSCFGNALFVRDAQDQDYLDTLQHRIVQIPSAFQRKVGGILFAAWGRIDYGRSLAKVAAYALLVALGYGVVYLLDMAFGWGLMSYTNSAESWLTPFYYSIVTYTTLGFGDITPKHWIGEIIVISEVIMGYVTLGLMLSILANKVARRS